MTKYIDIFFKVLLTLILIIPILGALKLIPGATRDLYNTDEAYNFIKMMAGNYLYPTIGLTSALTIVSMWTGRLALAMLLLLPITVNVIAFHLFLDGGLLTVGTIMGNVMALMHGYLLWRSRAQIVPLFHKSQIAKNL